MLKYSKKIIFVAMVLAVMLHCKISFAADSYEVDLGGAAIDSSQLKATRITPVLDAKINTGENLIYCSTFQMAWNSLCKDVLKGETAEIENAPDYVKALNNMLNQPPLVSEDSYVSIAGFGKDGVIDKIKNELIKKFKDPPLHLQKLLSSGPFDIVAFAYLHKNLVYECEFEKIKDPLNFSCGNDTIPVEAFGSIYRLFGGKIVSGNEQKYDHDKLVEQVEILYMFPNGFGFPYDREPFAYDGFEKYSFLPKGFIIKIKTKSDTDELIISTVPVEETLEKTYQKIYDLSSEKVEKYYNNELVPDSVKKNLLHRGIPENQFAEACNELKRRYLIKPAGEWIHTLIIPKINFNIIHSYQELIGRHLNKNKDNNYANSFIASAIQGIDFALNEKGALLKSFVFIGVCTGTPRDPFINCIVDRPFVIYLKNKNSDLPYFMAYIDNAELLVKK